MKLRNRLSLFSVLIFSVVIFLASAAIYISFYKWMQHNEIKVLENKTLLTAWYYLEKDEISFDKHESIASELRRSISRKDIALYDENNQLARGEMEHDAQITQEFISSIRKNKQAHIASSQYFYNGLFYEDNEGDFVVITREERVDFDNQMNTLLQILIIVFVIGVLLIFAISQLLGKLAYEPILLIMSQIRERDNRNFHQPITLDSSYAEIRELVNTYNHFTDRLGQLFKVQKNFIDYVSHELRTPLTALLGTIDVSQQKNRSKEECENTISQLKQYVTDLEETLDKMMLLSGAKTNFELQEVRIDEIIWEVIEHAVLYFQADVEVDIQVDDPSSLIVIGNADILELAFNNLIENAIKYSQNKPIKVYLKVVKDVLQIQIHDSGIGIDEKDIAQITQNFYRGENALDFQGKGIGLSMANIIFALHQMELSIHPQRQGTQVIVEVPKVNTTNTAMPN